MDFGIHILSSNTAVLRTFSEIDLTRRIAIECDLGNNVFIWETLANDVYIVFCSIWNISSYFSRLIRYFFISVALSIVTSSSCRNRGVKFKLLLQFIMTSAIPLHSIKRINSMSQNKLPHSLTQSFI